jgi:hypothetical protein
MTTFEPGTVFGLTGTALLSVEGTTGTVSVYAEAVDAQPPALLELRGDRELMDAAAAAEHVQLDIAGLKFGTHVAAQMMEFGNILVEAHPLFRALASNLEARNCN